VAFIQSPPDDCDVIHVAPPTALETRRTSRDRGSLERDYALGRTLGREAMESIAGRARSTERASA
jgi:predicted patatin/cPLA2 family phospholipase